MINFLCPFCNGEVYADTEKTLETYSRELGYKVLSGGEIDITTLQNYLVYRCDSCGKIQKMSIKDVEFQLRRSIAKKALNKRAVINFLTLPDEARTYDSEMFYCGKCAGVIDENKRDGYCLKNIAKYCSIYQGLKI